MKKIEAIIRLKQFEVIRETLAKIGVQFFTIKEVRGYGLQKGAHFMYRGSSFDADYIPRLQLDILTPENKLDDIIRVILQSGRTGEIGDGKISVLDVNAIYRIRTGESGAEAL